MAKEFDIYLNERLHQCDIIVYSIPYRDGLTVMERLILETCLESYTLQKFVAAQSGSVLASHIDEMIKTCLERLNNGVTVGTSAEFQVHYSSYPDVSALELNAERLSLLAHSYTSVENGLQIKTFPVGAYVKKSFGRGQSGIEVVSNVEATFKRDLERASPQLMLKAEALRTKKRASEKAESAIIVSAEPTDLFYRLCCTAAPSAIQIVSEAAETEIRFSLGRCTFSITLDSRVLGEQMTKYLAAESAIEVQSLPVTGTLKQFFVPGENALEIVPFEVEAIVKRHRLLYEMDADTLSAYDDMSLNDVDYVIL